MYDSERLTITEAVRQFRVSKINGRDCTYCNIGKVEKTDYFSSYHKFWSSNERNWIQMMDSWKMNHSFMKLTSFLEMLKEQYAIV